MPATRSRDHNVRIPSSDTDIPNANLDENGMVDPNPPTEADGFAPTPHTRPGGEDVDNLPASDKNDPDVARNDPLVGSSGGRSGSDGQPTGPGEFFKK